MSNRTRLHIRRLITAFCVLTLMWLILSMSEISGHNHATLYGENKPYSEWNMVVIFDNLLSK